MAEPKPLTAYQQTYHWRNKNCGPWAREWVKTNVPGIKVDHPSGSAEIVEVTSVTGDCDLGTRKGKLLTIYDLEVELRWEGKDKDGEEVKGKVNVPEVSHEAIDGLSDYVYQVSLTSDSTPAAQALLSHLKSALPPLLSDKFNSLRPALVAAHGAPSGSAESPSASGASTPVPAVGGSAYTPAPPTKAPDAAKKETDSATTTAKKPLSGTKTVELTAELQASAQDLWGLLTEEGKIPMWSRSAAQLKLSPGEPYSLFGGNVTGKIVSVEAPKKLVQTWQPKKPNWPGDHHGTLTIVLEEGSSSTKATFTLDGVPTGQEEEIEKAVDAFYIRGLKQMGLGAIL